MVATFNTMFDFGGVNGTPGTFQNVDGLGPPMLRFKTADDATIDNLNPIPIPAATQKRSFWKSIYLKCTGAPSVQVDNVRLYTTNDLWGAFVDLYVGNEMPTKNSSSSSGYKVATGAVGDDGTEMVAGYGGITGKTEFHTFVVGAPKSISISETGSKIDAINETTNYVVLQMDVLAGATPGNLADEAYEWKYDEV